jgi:polyribonucleotide nucleotidyltransferase
LCRLNVSLNKLFDKNDSKQDKFVNNSKDVCIHIPVDLIGLVIGKKGKTIKNIKRETNCTDVKIEENGLCKFEGPKSCAYKARKLVMKIIKDNETDTDDYETDTDDYETDTDDYETDTDDYESNDESNDEFIKTQIDIPKEMIGLIIGQNGNRIRKIKRESNCRIYIDSKSGLCKIEGSEENVLKTKLKIMKIIFNRSENNNINIEKDSCKNKEIKKKYNKDEDCIIL